MVRTRKVGKRVAAGVRGGQADAQVGRKEKKETRALRSLKKTSGGSKKGAEKNDLNQRCKKAERENLDGERKGNDKKPCKGVAFCKRDESQGDQPINESGGKGEKDVKYCTKKNRERERMKLTKISNPLKKERAQPSQVAVTSRMVKVGCETDPIHKLHPETN